MSPQTPPQTTSRQRSLDRSLFHGIAWIALAGWSGQFVSWAVLLYAARVLTPGDFGLVAMAMVPIGLARLIEDLGLDAAIVQNHKLTEGQTASLGGLAVGFGVLLCLIYFVLAELVSSFYSEPEVTAVVRTLSLLFILDALQVVPRALLQKELQYGKLAIVNATQLILSALTLGFCAYLGLSYWALVLNHVISNAIIVLLLFGFRPHRLAWPRNWSKLTGSLTFGGHMLVSRIAWYGYSKADEIVLGKMVGKDGLGVYSFAMTLIRIPYSEIGALSGRVVPGIFSAVQNSRGQLARYLLMLTEATAYLTVPSTIGIALVADEFVPLALGPQWYAVIFPLQVLSIYVVCAAVTSLWSHIFIWTGHARINMYLNLMVLAVMPPAFVAGAAYGVDGLAVAWAVMFPLTLIPAYIFLRRILRLRFMRFLDCLGPALISSAVMCAVVLSVRPILPPDWPLAARFGALVLAGAVSYGACLFFVFGRRVLRILSIIRRAI